MARYLFVSPDLASSGVFVDSRLDEATDRHRLAIEPPALTPSNDIERVLDASDVAGVIVQLSAGVLTPAQLQFIATASGRGRRVWVYWPAEEALEALDAIRLASYRRLLWFSRLYTHALGPMARLRRKIRRLRPALARAVYGNSWVDRRRIRQELEKLIEHAHPEPMSPTRAHIYEPFSPGSYAAVQRSHESRVPYIVEFGEAIAPPADEIERLAEAAAFRQASLIAVPSEAVRDRLIARGAGAWKILVNPPGEGAMDRIWQRLADDERTGVHAIVPSGVERVETGDLYKDQVQHQWDNNPVGSQYAESGQPQTLQWFLEIEAHRYGKYAPWMPETMEFAKHAGEDVLEVGAGMGTDLAQFARHGARTTDVDLSSGHLALARRNFELRGLHGRFVHCDAETIPCADNSFDLVYSNGVIHHTPHTDRVVREMYRVLRPGGRAIVMIYAESSLAYWRNIVLWEALRTDRLENESIGAVLSRTVERTENDAQPLVKVYTRAAARALFRDFVEVSVLKRHLEPFEIPRGLRPFIPVLERAIGWNLIVKARKPLA